MNKSIPFLELNELLTRWAINVPEIEDFTVENVLYALNLPNSFYEPIYRYLMSKRNFELNPGKMVICPNNHKIEILSLEEEVDEETFCFICGEEFYVDELIPVFSFTPQFRQTSLDEIKKKSKNNRERAIFQLT
ncbi:hypothetical protein [Virgibacillus dokdonensis]|uniref:hypothetical protein n=1 Tax=Virgibacillus dokdonensis TaxID=302167 RepID=UPI00098B64A2|nr:hypothetical protein [Virgibacillus dokdonensis]